MDEKKKMMVLAGLGAVFVCIGAFTFMPKSEEPPVTEKKEVPAFLVENENAKANEAALNPTVVANLPARDPFKAPNSMLQARTDTTVAPPPMPAPTRRQDPPVRLAGKVKPFDLSPIPGVNGNLGGGSGEIKVEAPAEEKKEEPQFSYTVGGVAVGQRPAAVFKDGQGNQRLVLQGGALDGETKVIAVKLAYVEVLFHGKKLRLPVGGESVAKQ